MPGFSKDSKILVLFLAVLDDPGIVSGGSPNP
jgi:hypothetical protein